MMYTSSKPCMGFDKRRDHSYTVNGCEDIIVLYCWVLVAQKV